MQREGTLNAYAIGSATNGESFTHGTVAAGDNDAFKRLETLTGTFNNLNLNADGVADVESGDVGLELGALDGTDDLINWGFPPSSQGRSKPDPGSGPSDFTTTIITESGLSHKRNFC